MIAPPAHAYISHEFPCFFCFFSNKQGLYEKFVISDVLENLIF